MAQYNALTQSEQLYSPENELPAAKLILKQSTLELPLSRDFDTGQFVAELIRRSATTLLASPFIAFPRVINLGL